MSDLSLVDLAVAAAVVVTWVVALAVTWPRPKPPDRISRRELDHVVEDERAAGRLS